MTEETKTENDTVKTSKKKAIKTLMLGAESWEMFPRFSQTALYATADGVKEMVMKYHNFASTDRLPLYSIELDILIRYPKEISKHFETQKGNVDAEAVRFVSDIGGEEYVYDLDDLTLTGAVEAELNGEKVTVIELTSRVNGPGTIPTLYIPGSKDEVIERISKFSASDDAILDICQEAQAILDKGAEAKVNATKELEAISQNLKANQPNQKASKTLGGRIKSLFGGKATKAVANDADPTAAPQAKAKAKSGPGGR